MSTVTTPAAKKSADKTGDTLGTGRRKTAVARVRMRAGSGKITINGRELENYFPSEKDRRQVVDPLDQADRRTSVDLTILVGGGGPAGQAAHASWASPARCCYTMPRSMNCSATPAC